MIEFRAVAAEPAACPPAAVVETPPVLVGASPAFERVRAEVECLAVTDGPVLVTGEAGSGRSLIARALHETGPRGRQLCAVVACHAFPETLLEIELFGCAKGSVVGATADRQGVLEMVDGGTVILENFEAVSVRMQMLLERYLQTGRVQAVGTLGEGNVVHTRLIAVAFPAPTTMKDAQQHAPLWRRLREHEIQVPALRARAADVPLLSQHFTAGRDSRGHGTVFSAEAMRALRSYSWPGNVAQLKSVVQRLAAQSVFGQVRQGDLPVGIRPRALAPAGRSASSPSSGVGDELFDRLQVTHESFWAAVYPLFMKREITRADLRALIARALRVARGDVGELTRILNMPIADQQKFERFLRRYDCEPQA